MQGHVRDVPSTLHLCPFKLIIQSDYTSLQVTVSQKTSHIVASIFVEDKNGGTVRSLYCYCYSHIVSVLANQL